MTDDQDDEHSLKPWALGITCIAISAALLAALLIQSMQWGQ